MVETPKPEDPSLGQADAPPIRGLLTLQRGRPDQSRGRIGLLGLAGDGDILA